MRTRLVAAALQSMPGFEIHVRTDMDVWLKYHAALLTPSLAAAFYACGEDRIRLAGTRDALVLALRAVREGFHVLRALGYPGHTPGARHLRVDARALAGGDIRAPAAPSAVALG